MAHTTLLILQSLHRPYTAHIFWVAVTEFKASYDNKEILSFTIEYIPTMWQLNPSSLAAAQSFRRFTLQPME